MSDVLRNWLAVGLLAVLLLCLAPVGFAYALLQSRGFWWFCGGAVLGAVLAKAML